MRPGVAEKQTEWRPFWTLARDQEIVIVV